MCGNGVIDENANEMCNDTNQVDGDGCSANCKSNETCPNGVQDPGEICDDGNDVNDDDCSNDCLSTLKCGNGVRDDGEECDDGEASGNEDFCIVEPNRLCKLAVCGDGWVWSTKGGKEECDGDGKGKGGETETCNANCTTRRCGDSIVNEEADEFCDDGDGRNGRYGYCKSDCSGQGEECGDSHPNGPEVCDDGDANSDTTYGACGEDCGGWPMGKCGDGQEDPQEQCDDGTWNNTRGRCFDCQRFCGDGVERDGEECDAGTQNGVYGSGCTSDCKDGGARCRDDALQTDDETCDVIEGDVYYKGSTVPEICDNWVDTDGQENNDAGGNVSCTCRGDCGYCGDNQTYTGPDAENPVETCDPPGSGRCRHDCTFCGDDHENGDENCDDGGDNGKAGFCRSDCSGRCGDGDVNGPEDCEPRQDGCTAACRWSSSN